MSEQADERRSGAGAHAHEDMAAWIADVNVGELVDEFHRRSEGEPSLPAFENVGDDLVERALLVRRAEVEALSEARVSKARARNTQVFERSEA